MISGAILYFKRHGLNRQMKKLRKNRVRLSGEKIILIRDLQDAFSDHNYPRIYMVKEELMRINDKIKNIDVLSFKTKMELDDVNNESR